MPENITLFAYLNIDHPMVAWEVAIGRIKSSCDNKNNFGISLWRYNLLKGYADNGIVNKFINELKLEQVRQLFFPEKVSRLKGIYLFETKKTAEIALERWGMSWKKKYITAVNFSANFLTRVDSEWITWYLNSGEHISNNDSWMKEYWGGEIFGKNPLVEILASGIGVIQNHELRSEAYRKIYNLWLTSTPLLAAACCAFKIKSMEEVALMKPALIGAGDSIKGCFYINMNDFNTREKDICDSVEVCKQNNECPSFSLPLDKSKIFTLPDMKDYIFEFKSQQGIQIYNNIHTGD